MFAADAQYGVVQVRRGVVGDAYSNWILPRLVGISKAAEILLSGATFDGHEAVRLGLGSRVLDADEVLPAALRLAHDIAENTAPASVAASKRLLWDSFELDRAARPTPPPIRLPARGRTPDLDAGGAQVLDRSGGGFRCDAGRQA